MSSTTSTKIVDQVKVHFKFIKEDHYFGDERETRNIYKVYVSYNGKKTSFSFGDSINNTIQGIMLDDTKDKPGLLENIYSDYYLTEENYPTIQDFAKEFGYNSFSTVDVRKIYKRCLAQGNRLHKLFNDKEIEQIRSELDF